MDPLNPTDPMDEITGYMRAIDELTGQTRIFAEVCFENKTMEELQQPHGPDDANTEDCEQWRITARHWSDAMEAALQCRLAYAGEKQQGSS